MIDETELFGPERLLAVFEIFTRAGVSQLSGALIPLDSQKVRPRDLKLPKTVGYMLGFGAMEWGPYGGW